MSRRGFVLGSAGGAAMLALGLVKFAPETALCRPPGGQDEDRLLGMCVRCGKCMEVCPTGALTPSEGSTFDNMCLGTAVINRDWCLAWRLKGCTICLNACPLGAISFDGNNRPVVDERLCNGCGACEQACVSLESTSIGQDENNKHMTARAITVQQLER